MSRSKATVSIFCSTRRALALTCLAFGACTLGTTPDVGMLAAVSAPPAEEVEIVTLGRNQTLGQVLDIGLDVQEQTVLLMAFGEHADPRRMRVGTEITLRYLAASRLLRGVDVAINSDTTVRLSRESDAWRSATVTTPTYIDTVYASADIEDNLWLAVVRNPDLASIPTGDRNQLIDELDDVFQWQVDFSRQIQKGDTYRFAFERTVRPDGSMRAGRLLAAELVNAGVPFHAVFFDPDNDGRGSYYDLDGNSVRRAFLLKPLEYRRISSVYSTGRFHPILQRWRAHRGIDYAAASGTPVMATSDGVVVQRGPRGALGNAVEIRHANNFVTRYGHLRAFAAGVSTGRRVRQGDVIGYVGMTGLATGPHLHYEMLRGGNHMDPLSVDLPTGDPVAPDNLTRWRSEMTARVALLQLIPSAGPVRTAVASTGGASDGATASADLGG